MSLHPPDSSLSDLQTEVVTAACHITSNDDVAEARVREWLDSTGLRWPGPFRLTIKVSGNNPFPDDHRETFHQAGIAIQAGPDAGTVRISWALPLVPSPVSSAPTMDSTIADAPAPPRSPLRAAAEVHATLPEAVIWMTPDAVQDIDTASRGFLLIVLVFLMRRLGWYHVHGAALTDPRGRGWLIAGDSNCGKSTTTALVATRGWQIGTDDIGFLAMRGDTVVSMGVRTRIALRAGGVALLGATGGEVMQRRKKEGFWPEELGGAWAPVVVPRIVAFPRIGERTAIEKSTPRVALSNIVMWSHWVLYEPQFAQEHLDVLGKVVRQAQCYNLTLGPDLFENPDLLENLIPS